MIWRGDGSKAPWARLSRTATLAPGTARGILRRGHATTAMPATAAAWAAGEIGADHVELLANAASNGRGDLFTRDENVLVDHCLELTWGQLVKAVRYWTFRADTELDRDGSPPPPISLRISTTFDGTVTGDFTLDPIGGATVTEALRRIERDLYRADQRDGVVRTMSERMAAALVEMAIRSQTAPRTGGGRSRWCASSPVKRPSSTCASCPRGWSSPPTCCPPPRAQPGADVHPRRRRRVLAASPTRTFRGMLRRAIQSATATANIRQAVTNRSPTATSTTVPLRQRRNHRRTRRHWNANHTTATPTSTTALPGVPD